MTTRNDDARAVGTGPGTENTNSQETRPDSRAFSADGEALEFLDALCPDGAALAEDERLILCAFRGDPGAENVPGKWRPSTWLPGRPLKINVQSSNAYVTVSACRRSVEDGKWRRRIDNCSAGLTLMVDDVGTKVAPEFLRAAPPSAVIETSPANFQVHYFFDEPLRDVVAFDTLIRSTIATLVGPGGADPGMGGVTRVARLPGGLNMKPKHGGAFRVRTVLLEPGRRWTPMDLVRALGIDRLVVTPHRAVEVVPDDEAAMRRAEYQWVGEWLAENGLLMRRRGPRWTDVRCPWEEGHSERARSGAAIGEPRPENGWYGAFQCHHGHCEGRTWRSFVRWVEAARSETFADFLARGLDATNANAPEELPT